MSSHTTWSGEDDEILIHFVRNHEGLYNVKNKDYRRTHVKQNWWREIGEILNKTDFDCSKRWCYIRDYYIRRRGKPCASGEAARKRSVHLSFLDNLPTSKYSISDLVDENLSNGYLYDVRIDYNSSSEQIHNTNNSNDAEDSPRKSIRRSTRRRSTLASHSSAKTNDTNVESLVDSSVSNAKVVSTHDNSETLHSQNSIIKVESSDSDNSCSEDENDLICKEKPKTDKKCKIGQESLNLLDSKDELDENDLFFGSMTKIVKKLPRYEQVQLRMQIGSLIGAAELRHISNN